MTTLTDNRTDTRWLMLAVLLLGQFMALLDTFVVNVAMPTIGANFHASGAWLQLVVGGYMVAYAMTLITGARLGDLYGRRRMFRTGVVLFTLASLACGLAPGILLLVVFRVIQGIAAAVMVPQIMSVIQTRFTGSARSKALSAYGATLSAGQVAGLVVGGLLTNANLFGTSWRPVFLVNVPLGLVLAFLVPRLLPTDVRAERVRRFDVIGLALATSAVLLIVLPLVIGHEIGWPVWAFVCIAAGLVLAAVFVQVERRVAIDPLLNLDVLRAPGLPSGVITLACMQLTTGGFLFAFTLHLQAGLGESPLRAALTWLPFAATFGAVGYFWRVLPTRVHYAVVPTGMALSAIGFIAIPLLWPALVITGAGMGLSASPLVTQSLHRVPPARAADASGLLTTTMQLSQATGVAAFGTLFLSSANDLTRTTLALALTSAVGLIAGTFLARTARTGRLT
ncbi:MFS transporter [Kribbella kalugense]|uniref:MFS transporter n=1 Tax=Kribbella kalugense TaxID=2512221 RepID=A0A4R8A690_9ACTN|nr:MFS transporter [Kribbella kalugense]TDW23800.1 MFS transporter [Kribbella kalugense]